jgi:glutamine amidotransferase
MLDPRTSTYKEKSWIFTHNGTMPGIKSDQVFRTRIEPHGNTDSEYIFCYLIEQLREVYIRNGYILSAYERSRLIEEYANAISRAYPENLNFIMSDGERVYAYYGGYDIAGGLWYCTQTRSSDKLAMLETHDGMTIHVSGNDESNTVSFIAARPLTGEGWEKFKLNELKVFKDGREIK